MDNFKRSLPPLSSLVPFEAAARLQSFSKASQELNLTQAAISKQIRALEEYLDVTLFTRRNRAVFLTATGREFRDVVRSSLLGLATKTEELRKKRDAREVALTVQLCEAFYWLTPKLPLFHQRFPEIDTRLNASTAPITEVTEKFDIAIQSTGRPSGGHSRLFTISDEIFPVCSPGYWQQLPAASRTLEHLAELPLLHHWVVPQDWMTWAQWLARYRLALLDETRGKFFDSYPVMMQACVEGFGFALGWRRTTEKMIDNGELIRPFEQSIKVDEALAVYQWQNSPLRARSRSLLQWLRRVCQD